MWFVRKAARLRAAFLLLLPGLNACALHPWLSPHDRAEIIAREAGFESHKANTGSFLLTTFQSSTSHDSDTLTVYIEGDGAPWGSVNTPPGDPTPPNPVSLILATRDPRRPLVYIARPCQFLDQVKLSACSPKYWTSARFSIEVVAAFDQVVDKTKAAYHATRIRLVGFSGGGVIAALIAARRDDIESLVTVAAPLDVAAWSTFHQITPLNDSLDPMNFIPALSSVKQLHLLGEKDRIVSPTYARNLQARMPFAKFVLTPGYTHDCCWAESWPAPAIHGLQ
jgi:pimeloyl-ACP methyl ester carboxylesterase